MYINSKTNVNINVQGKNNPRQAIKINQLQ